MKFLSYFPPVVPRLQSVARSMRCIILLLFPAWAAWAAEPGAVTFIATSDTHYAVPDPEKGDGDKNEGERKILASMNVIEGKKFPASLKGVTICKPMGVLVAGDLINGGSLPQDALRRFNRPLTPQGV